MEKTAKQIKKLSDSVALLVKVAYLLGTSGELELRDKALDLRLQVYNRREEILALRDKNIKTLE